MERRTHDYLGPLGYFLIGMGCLLSLQYLAQPTMRPTPWAKALTTGTQVRLFHLPVQMYVLDNGRPPTTAQGLNALLRCPTIAPLPSRWRGPYLTDIPSIPKDAWGNDYLYQSPGPRGEPFVITSLGRDGRPGGEELDADISSVDPLPASARMK